MRSLFFAALTGSALASSGRAENLFENGSFELPAVKGRTRQEAGGNPVFAEKQITWSLFAAQSETTGGELSVGMTDEIARTGKQALYLDFAKVTAPSRSAALVTKLIPIKPAKPYRVSMWARIDRKRPLALDERRPHLWLDIEFFQADQKTPAGEPISGAQLIPGRVVPGGPHELIFVSGKWTESFSQITSPENAAFIKVSWSWTTPSDEGETDGVIYWDDASLEGERGTSPLASEREQPAPTGEGTPASQPPAKP